MKIAGLPKISRRQIGRVRPVVLGLVLIVAGLLLEQWWWQLGAVLLIAVLVESYFRYVTLD